MLVPEVEGVAAPPVVLTNDDGEARIRLLDATADRYVLVVNAADHMPLRLEKFASAPVVCLPRLPKAEGGLGWWHRALGIATLPADSGAGLVVGVIDGGCATRPDCLNVRDCGCVISSEYCPDSAGTDSAGHGTAVIGLLAARPADLAQYGGVAPGVTVLSLKAFDPRLGELTTGTQGEIAEAMFRLVEQGADLINCSFSLDESHASIAQQVEEAYDQGVLCICAGGNEPGGVAFPGCLDRAVAVAALGRGDAVQPGTLIAAHVPRRTESAWREPYFFASFSGRGPGIDCCAPGVGLVAPAPPRVGHESPFQVVSGTSFACPLVCGILATALAADPDYRALPRDASRAAYGRRRLESLCEPLGFPDGWEGRGLPRLRTSS